ncbi:MAG: hypothetical protein A2583_00530 [Bdellovibrionales bacterium RIFOXYD1_FULL_53_11]|nr:MAG: hypothetical protein A2583_00530 [Bdellovibrionales bacterium RIFOXYD1_FULL_53_11]
MVRRDEKGQAVLEYVLMLAILVAAFAAAMKTLDGFNLQDKFSDFVKKDFTAAYRYGHVKAKGPDEGGAQYHPRMNGGDTNFRIFISPKKGGG